MNLKKEEIGAAVKNLFSNSIASKDYDTALIYIKLYSTLTNIDMDIYVNILNKILGLNTFFMEKKDNILGVKNVPSSILINYNHAIDKINNNDYNAALKHICICEKIINIKGLDIDLELIEYLLKSLCIRNHKLQRKSQITELEVEFFNGYNIGYCYYILHKLKDLVEDDTNIILMLIETCLQLKDYDQVEDLLNYFTDCSSELSNRLGYYHKEVIIHKVNFSKCVDYAYFETQLESLFNCEDFYVAERLVEDKVLRENNSIYMYKYAELLYVYNYYEKAKKIFLEYLSTHNLHQKNVYYYLYFIALQEEDIESADTYLKIIFELTRYVDSNVDLNKLKIILSKYKDSFTDKVIYNLEKDIFCELEPQRNKYYKYNI